jgi:hypothetical protein
MLGKSSCWAVSTRSTHQSEVAFLSCSKHEWYEDIWNTRENPIRYPSQNLFPFHLPFSLFFPYPPSFPSITCFLFLYLLFFSWSYSSLPSHPSQEMYGSLQVSTLNCSHSPIQSTFYHKYLLNHAFSSVSPATALVQGLVTDYQDSNCFPWLPSHSLLPQH